MFRSRHSIFRHPHCAHSRSYSNIIMRTLPSRSVPSHSLSGLHCQNPEGDQLSPPPPPPPDSFHSMRKRHQLSSVVGKQLTLFPLLGPPTCPLHDCRRSTRNGRIDCSNSIGAGGLTTGSGRLCVPVTSRCNNFSTAGTSGIGAGDSTVVCALSQYRVETAGVCVPIEF